MWWLVYLCILYGVHGFRPFMRRSIERTHMSMTSPQINWYVVGETTQFRKNRLHKVTVWDHDYVIWHNNNTFIAMDDHCSHRGASLARGQLTPSGCVMCPYHGYEFNSSGILCKVPGLQFNNTPCQNQRTYAVVEKHGWVYLNTVASAGLVSTTESDNIFMEREAFDPDFSVVYINKDFQAYARTVSENSLDVMHIGFVHTFGNREQPSPTQEIPPYQVDPTNPLWFRTAYSYKAGDQSIAKRVYQTDELIIENEFVLPHTTVARIMFGSMISTVVTFATPINETHSHMYVKTYRNFWRAQGGGVLADLVNHLGNQVTRRMMELTIEQDKGVVEHIRPQYRDGRFNMKYDKLQNVYRSMYRKWVRPADSRKPNDIYRD